MTREEVIQLARECGFQNPWEKLVGCGGAWVGENAVLERFYYAAFRAGAEAEREACTKVCDSVSHENPMTAGDCADAIRARGEK